MESLGNDPWLAKLWMLLHLVISFSILTILVSSVTFAKQSVKKNYLENVQIILFCVFYIQKTLLDLTLSGRELIVIWSDPITYSLTPQLRGSYNFWYHTDSDTALVVDKFDYILSREHHYNIQTTWLEVLVPQTLVKSLQNFILCIFI